MPARLTRPFLCGESYHSIWGRGRTVLYLYALWGRTVYGLWGRTVYGNGQLYGVIAQLNNFVIMEIIIMVSFHRWFWNGLLPTMVLEGEDDDFGTGSFQRWFWKESPNMNGVCHHDKLHSYWDSSSKKCSFLVRLRRT